MGSRLTVEDCRRFDIAALFRSRVVRFDGVTEGVWHSLAWRTFLSDRGSFLEISGRRWSLVPIRRKNVLGVQWLVLGRDGRRYRHLLVAPDGRVGTRTELGARYRSQRLWTARKQRAWRRAKVIEKLDGPTEFQWVMEHENYVPEKPRSQRWTTYRRLRKRLVTTPREQPELSELPSRHRAVTLSHGVSRVGSLGTV
jgi:hypothetical protein